MMSELSELSELIIDFKVYCSVCGDELQITDILDDHAEYSRIPRAHIDVVPCETCVNRTVEELMKEG